MKNTIIVLNDHFTIIMENDISPSPPSRRILYNVMIGAFLAMFDGGVLNVGLPTLRNIFNVDIDTIKWATSSYMLALSSLLPVLGSIADKRGRRNMYSYGFLVIAIFTIACSFSPSFEFLVAFRALQGIGGSMFMANGMAIAVENYPPEEKGRNLGIIFAVHALGGLSGPPIGGILIGLFGWKSVFYITFIIALIGYIVSMNIIPKDEKEGFNFSDFDLIGAISLVIFISSFVFGFSSINKYGWKSVVIISSISICVISLTVFIVTEKNHEHPLIVLGIFSNWTFTASILASFLAHITMFSPEVLLPFYYQDVKGYNSVKTGLLMIAFPVAIVIASPIGGKLSDKFGPMPIASSGLVLNTVSLLLLAFVRPSTSVYLVFIIMACIGLSQGLFMSPNSSSVMGSVEKTQFGVATGINQLAKNMGTVIGMTFSVELFSSFLKSGPTDTYPTRYLDSVRNVYIISAILSFIGIILSINRNKKETTESK